MRHVLFLITALVLTSMPYTAVAADNCDQQFGLNVASCSQTLNSQNLGPKERADAQKACIEDARAAKIACKSGVNTCATNCANSYVSAVAACESTNNPAQCGLNTECAAFMTQQRGVCLAGVTDTLATCEGGCGLTAVSQCLVTSGSTYDAAVVTACDEAFDIAKCGGAIDCEGIFDFLRPLCAQQTLSGAQIGFAWGGGSALVTALDQAADTLLSSNSICLAP